MAQTTTTTISPKMSTFRPSAKPTAAGAANAAGDNQHNDSSLSSGAAAAAGIERKMARLEQPPRIVYLKEPSAEKEAPEPMCCICYRDVPPKHAFISAGCHKINCSSSSSADSADGDTDENDDPIAHEPHPMCSLCAPEYLGEQVKFGYSEIACYQSGCRNILTMDDMARALGKGDIAAGQQHSVFLDWDQLKFRQIVELTGGIEGLSICPTRGCSYAVEVSTPGVPELTECPCCNDSFCSNCRRPYHYRTTCTEYERFRREWEDWETSGRALYWKYQAVEYQKAKNRENKKQGTKKTATMLERKALIALEKEKERTCRLCPHCGRLADPDDDGDDANANSLRRRRCGYAPSDPTGSGTRHSGCHQFFDWADAPLYQSSALVAKRRIDGSAKDKPLHEGWRCDECHEEVRGLRLECLQCQSYSICERCDNNSNMNDCVHDASHVFRLLQVGET